MLCQACQREKHDHCDAQINHAEHPCDCTYCWGEGGSTRVYNDIYTATLNRLRRIAEKKEGSIHQDPV